MEPPTITSKEKWDQEERNSIVQMLLDQNLINDAKKEMFKSVLNNPNEAELNSLLSAIGVQIVDKKSASEQPSTSEQIDTPSENTKPIQTSTLPQGSSPPIIELDSDSTQPNAQATAPYFEEPKESPVKKVQFETPVEHLKDSGVPQPPSRDVDDEISAISILQPTLQTSSKPRSISAPPIVQTVAPNEYPNILGISTSANPKFTKSAHLFDATQSNRTTTANMANITMDKQRSTSAKTASIWPSV